MLSFDIFPIGDYYRSGLSIHFIMTGFTLIWFVICCYLADLIEKQYFFSNIISFWSKHVTSIYIVQWIVYGWSIFISYNNSSACEAVSIGIFVLLLTHLTVEGFYLIKTKYLIK